MATLYETLGVREDASDDEIKRAYRKAAMRAHPDRNQGREASAHDAFQEIKEAYSILSDPDQRGVYDAVYAEEIAKVRRREAQEAQQAQEARERAERQAQAERDRYEKYVSHAMRYAERGHNRDVVFGVLLGRGCDEALAARIADGVAALSASRTQATMERHGAGVQAADAVADRPARRERPARSVHKDDADQSDQADQTDQTDQTDRPDRPDAARPTEQPDATVHAGLFTSLWHGIFGVRP